jgi:uncharacterized membrane protein
MEGLSMAPSTEPKATTASLSDATASPELLISALLRYGVLSSLALVALGMLLTFFHHPDYFSSAEALHRLTAPENAPHQLSDVTAGVMTAHGQAFVMVGLLVMMAIPVLRVAFSLRIFRLQRDWAFVALTSMVLVLLICSFILGKAEGG